MFGRTKFLELFGTVFGSNYSSVPNRRVGRNKRAGGKILEKTLNVQAKIDMHRGNFLENQ